MRALREKFGEACVRSRKAWLVEQVTVIVQGLGDSTEAAAEAATERETNAGQVQAGAETEANMATTGTKGAGETVTNRTNAAAGEVEAGAESAEAAGGQMVGGAERSAAAAAAETEASAAAAAAAEDTETSGARMDVDFTVAGAPEKTALAAAEETAVDNAPLAAADAPALTAGLGAASASPHPPTKRWHALNEDERAAATTLGYAEHSWDGDWVPPNCAMSAWDADPEAIRSWDELTEEMRTAATTVGYTWDKWDEEMLPEGRPMDNHPQTSMFQKNESALAFDQRQGANFECKVLARRWKGEGQWEYRVHYLGWKAKWDQWLTNENVFKMAQHNIKLLETQMGDRPLTKKEKKALAAAEKAKKQEERDAIRKEREAKFAAEKAAQEAAREEQRLARKREREAAAAVKAAAKAAAKAEAEAAQKAKRKKMISSDTDPARKKRKRGSAAASKRRRLSTGDKDKAAQRTVEAEQNPEEHEHEQEDWLTTGHRWIGLKGMRHFHDGSVFGAIVSWLPARASTTPEPDDVALWRFQHADNDQEDLEEYEVREAVAELREHEARKAAPQRSAEENWEAFVKLRDSHRAEAARQGGWQCKKGDKLLCFDRNKSTSASVEVANCYEAVVLRVRPASAMRVTTSPPSGEDASLTRTAATLVGAGASGHSKAVATAADTSVPAINPAIGNVTDESSCAGGLSAPNEAKTCSPSDDLCNNSDELRYYLHFLGYSKGQDRWECESNFVPMTEEARALKVTMHNQWDRKKSASASSTMCRLPGDPENVQLVRGAVRYGATVPDVIPESLNGILPPVPITRTPAKQGDPDNAAGTSTSDTGSSSADAGRGIHSHVQTASLHLQQFGCTTLEAGLGEEDVSACATVIETWFNHVVIKLNTLGLQEVMKNVGFTEFKTRGPGRYDLNPPALKSDDAFAFFRSDEAPWVEVCRSILGDDMRCIAMGCMLSMPGSDAQPMHQDGPHLNADEYDKQEKRRLDAEATGSKSKHGTGPSKQFRNVQHQSPYAINVFVPLVDITVENGGTEFWLGTHRLGAAAVICNMNLLEVLHPSHRSSLPTMNLT